MQQGSWEQRLAERFHAELPVREGAWRRLGREGEHPIVHPDGSAADIAVLWPHLIASGEFNVAREGELIVALEGEQVIFSSEVGRATLEIIVGPVDDLHEIASHYEAAMAAVLAAADAEGLWVLGYGVQPLTEASRELMTPKQRYGVLLEVLGDAWLWFSVTASDQVHVDVSADEAVPATDLANLLSPVMIALCANSPVLAGHDSGVASSREAHMGGIHAEASRHGIPEGPSSDAAGWIGRTLSMPYLMHRSADRDEPVGVPFGDWLGQQVDLSTDAAFDAWLHHEHYVWNSARPRTAHGTVELRACCQQPWADHMAPAALETGMIAAWQELATWMDELLGDQAWSVMRRWHGEVVEHGLAAPEPVEGLIEGVLTRCEAALVVRGRGEEVFLRPLWQRYERRMNPAQLARAAFADGGVAAVVELMRVR
jgi:gamma-glutamylcysteine synthetase